MRGRLPTLLLLSVVIWALEVAVVGVAIPGVGAGLSELAPAMLALLSGLSAGATPLMPGSGDRLVEVLTDFGVTADVGIYRACLVVPAVARRAPWRALAYLPWRAPRAPGGARVKGAHPLRGLRRLDPGAAGGVLASSGSPASATSSAAASA